MLIVPDNILEQLICDVCHKYLSVTPVKIAYINNECKKICGRCFPTVTALSNDSQQELVVSHLYTLLSENMLFKCTNRFAGCGKLLTCDEVLSHEKLCYAKSLFCFICNFNSMINKGISESPAIDGCAILQHLKQEHQESYQANSSMIRTSLRALEKWNTFYYVMDDCIFITFVKFKRRDQAFLFKVCYIGNTNENKVVQVNGNIIIESTMVTQNLLFGSNSCRKVEVIVKVCQLLLNDAPVNIELHWSFPYYRQLYQLQQNPNFKGAENYRKLRKLQIRGTPPAAINLNSTETKLVIISNSEEIELNVECILCFGITSDNIFITNKGKSKILLCRWCAYIYKAPFEDLNDFYNFNIISNLSFYCIWDCGSFMPSVATSNYDRHGNYVTTSIITHEIFECNKVPHQKCPVQNCFFTGTFNIIKKQLLTLHNQNMIFENYAILQRNVIDTNLNKPIIFYIIISQAYVHGSIKIDDNTVKDAPFTIELSLNDPYQDYSGITAVVSNGPNYRTLLTSFSTKCSFYINHLPMRLHIVPHLLKLTI